MNHEKHERHEWNHEWNHEKHERHEKRREGGEYEPRMDTNGTTKYRSGTTKNTKGTKKKETRSRGGI